jgi:hypothetical protein
MQFSDRIGATKPTLELYVDTVPQALKNSIWNSILATYDDGKDNLHKLCVYLAKNFRKSRVDQVPNKHWELKNWLEDYYFSLAWYDIYNLVEFLFKHQYYILYHFPGARVDQRKLDAVKTLTEGHFNKMFEIEHSGFRFIGGVLSQITDAIELKSISDSLEDLTKSGLSGGKKHIQTALEHFSKRPNPDYRNSIKESISAVESVAKIIGSKDGDGIANALRVLSEKTSIHGALRSAFEKLYGFTSDDDGIRHAMIDDPSVGFDEAKYMIISCSAFCSYLIGKAQSSGLFDSPKITK